MNRGVKRCLGQPPGVPTYFQKSPNGRPGALAFPPDTLAREDKYPGEVTMEKDLRRSLQEPKERGLEVCETLRRLASPFPNLLQVWFKPVCVDLGTYISTEPRPVVVMDVGQGAYVGGGGMRG